jgi:tRNA(fMet)-specific endonuclease VapC
MVVLDTNIIIDHLRQPPGTDTILKKVVLEKDELALSVLSVQELYEGKSTRDAMAKELIQVTVSSFRILAYTFETAQRAGELARDLERPISFPDAAIAATAILNEASLLTLNIKDFEGIENLDLLRI